MRVFVVFTVFLYFISNAIAAPGNPTCVDASGALASNITEAAILGTLVSTDCGMQLNSAVYTILDAGGDQVKTLMAALLIDPEYTYIDPTNGLAPTAAGGDSKPESPNDSESAQTTTGDGGGASPS